MAIIFLLSIFIIPAFISVLNLSKNLRWILSSLSFALISAARPEVGMDYVAYQAMAEQENTFIELLYWYKEPISASFVYLGQAFSLELMLFLFAICFALGVFAPILYLSKIGFITYFSALYLLPMVIVTSFDVVRQAAGMGFLMLFLLTGKKTSALASVGAHLASIFSLPVIYAARFKERVFLGLIIGLVISTVATNLRPFSVSRGNIVQNMLPEQALK